MWYHLSNVKGGLIEYLGFEPNDTQENWSGIRVKNTRVMPPPPPSLFASFRITTTHEFDRKTYRHKQRSNKEGKKREWFK